jgi:hypothetical protein
VSVLHFVSVAVDLKKLAADGSSCEQIPYGIHRDRIGVMLP